jgi:DNA-directed RNA polymerase specialized sigma24 family protein
MGSSAQRSDRELLRAARAVGRRARGGARARIVHERDYDRIAADLGQSEPAIRKRVSRGRDRLRREMGADRP